MKKLFLLTAMLVGASLIISSCGSTSNSREEYFGYAPSKQNAFEQTGYAGKLEEEPKWKNPMSPDYAEETLDNVRKESDNVEVRYVYYRTEPAFVPVMVPWWGYYWDYPVYRYHRYPRFHIHIGFGYYPVFWDYWYNPWYDFHPYYGYSWASNHYYWNWRNDYWHRHHWYWGDYGRRYPKKEYYERKDRNFGPGRGSIADDMNSKAELRANRKSTSGEIAAVQDKNVFKSRSEKLMDVDNSKSGNRTSPLNINQADRNARSSQNLSSSKVDDSKINSNLPNRKSTNTFDNQKYDIRSTGNDVSAKGDPNVRDNAFKTPVNNIPVEDMESNRRSSATLMERKVNESSNWVPSNRDKNVENKNNSSWYDNYKESASKSENNYIPRSTRQSDESSRSSSGSRSSSSSSTNRSSSSSSSSSGSSHSAPSSSGSGSSYSSPSSGSSSSSSSESRSSRSSSSESSSGSSNRSNRGR